MEVSDEVYEIAQDLYRDADFDLDRQGNVEAISVMDFEDYDGYYRDCKKEDYDKAVEYLNSLLTEDTKFYDGYLELNDNHTIRMINIPEGKEFELDDYNFWYDKALKNLEEEIGTEVYGLGRSGRHICVEDTFKNLTQLDKYKEAQEKWEKWLIAEVEKDINNTINESKDKNEKIATCTSCGEKIVYTKYDINSDIDSDYIVCPKCGTTIDVLIERLDKKTEDILSSNDYVEYKDYVRTLLKDGAIDDPEYVKTLSDNEFENLLVNTWMKDPEILSAWKELHEGKEIKTETSHLRAVDIDWEVDDEEDLETLPTEIDIPEGIEDEDDISDYLSDLTGFLHNGFELKKVEESKEVKKENESVFPEIINDLFKDKLTAEEIDYIQQGVEAYNTYEGEEINTDDFESIPEEYAKVIDIPYIADTIRWVEGLINAEDLAERIKESRNLNESKERYTVYDYAFADTYNPEDEDDSQYTIYDNEREDFYYDEKGNNPIFDTEEAAKEYIAKIKKDKKEEKSSIIITQDINTQEEAQSIANDSDYFMVGENIEVKDWNGNIYNVVKTESLEDEDVNTILDKFAKEYNTIIEVDRFGDKFVDIARPMYKQQIPEIDMVIVTNVSNVKKFAEELGFILDKVYDLDKGYNTYSYLRDDLKLDIIERAMVFTVYCYTNKRKKEESKKLMEYYKMPDDEHIIWDSEIDYYDEDYMEDIKNTYYQDYLDDLEEGEEPEDFETWYEGYIADDYDTQEYLIDDLNNNIFPAIDKQCVSSDILVLSGNYGSNYPDFRPSGEGGKLFAKGTADFRNYIGGFDRVCITTQDGILGAILNDHDGTITGRFYTLPDNEEELMKAMGYEERVEEEYSAEDIDKYGMKTLMADIFADDIYYGGVEAKDLTEHIDLLKPIKDTISGYTPNDPKGTKKESRKIKFEAKEDLSEKFYEKICRAYVDTMNLEWVAEDKMNGTVVHGYFENDDYASEHKSKLNNDNFKDIYYGQFSDDYINSEEPEYYSYQSWEEFYDEYIKYGIEEDLYDLGLEDFYISRDDLDKLEIDYSDYIDDDNLEESKRVIEADDNVYIDLEPIPDKLYKKLLGIVEEYSEALDEDEEDIFGGTEDSYANELLSDRLSDLYYDNDFKMYISDHWDTTTQDNAIKAYTSVINKLAEVIRTNKLSNYKIDKKLKTENSTEDYWDAKEILRDGFMSLMKFNFGTDSKGNNYIITSDSNDIKRFRADNDEQAKELYKEFIKDWNTSEHSDLTMNIGKVVENVISLSDKDKSKYYYARGIVTGQATPYGIYKIDNKYYNENGIEIEEELVKDDIKNFERIFSKIESKEINEVKKSGILEQEDVELYLNYIKQILSNEAVKNKDISEVEAPTNGKLLNNNSAIVYEIPIKFKGDIIGLGDNIATELKETIPSGKIKDIKCVPVSVNGKTILELTILSADVVSITDNKKLNIKFLEFATEKEKDEFIEENNLEKNIDYKDKGPIAIELLNNK